MSDKVHFKLAYNGETHKFASTLRGDQLFTAVTGKVVEIVNKEDYELFWTDEDSNVVLESAADLSTTIEYAMCTRKSASKSPCVYLTAVVKQKPFDEVPEQMKEAASPNLLDQVKQQLRQLFDSALDDQWTADLRSKMQPLITLKSPEDLRSSEYSAAEIAVFMDQLEQKVSEELKEQLVQLPRDQLAELLMSNWIEDDAKERGAAKGGQLKDQDSKWTDAVLNAAADVRFVVELALNKYTKDEDDEEMEDDDENGEEEEEEDSESDDGEQDWYDPEEYEMRKTANAEWKKKLKKIEEEEKEVETSWEGKQAAAILKLARDKKDSVYSQLVYSTPEERVQQAEAAAAARKSPEVVDAAAVQLCDPVAKLEQHLRQLPLPASEQQQRKALFESEEYSMRLSMSKHDANDLLTSSSMKDDIAEILLRLEQSVPVDMQQKLHGLQPEELSRLVMLNWIDHFTEDNRRLGLEQLLKSPEYSAGSLGVLCYVAAAAAMLPKELKELIDEIYQRDIDDYKKKNPEKVKRDIVEQQESQLILARSNLSSELEQYMNYRKAETFGKRFFPCPWQSRQTIPGEEEDYADIVELLSLSDEMKEVTEQLQQSHVHSAMTESLLRCMQNMQLEDLLELRGDRAFEYSLPSLVADDWMKAMSKDKKTKTESNSLEYSSSTLIALLAVCAAARFRPEVLHRRLIRLKVTKSVGSGSGFMEAEHSSPQHIQSTWIKQQAADILQQGLARLDAMLSHSEQSDGNILQQDLDAREWKITIKEKALKMKEDVFERQVASFQLKMEEFKEKFEDLEKRVGDVEEKMDSDYLESRMDEMDERLKKVEEKIYEDDMEIV